MKKLNYDDFFKSGWSFNNTQKDLQSRYQMLNIGLVLSSVALVYGIIGNVIRDISGLIFLELFLIFMNLMLFLILRKYRGLFEQVAFVLTAQFSFLFLFLIYIYEPSSLKHIWLFTYPIILLYFQNKKNSLYWLSVVTIILIIAPLQNFIEVKYSLYQVTYIAFVLIILSIIIYFYKINMDKAKKLILKQQDMLQKFNIELAGKLEELKAKDKLLTAQSKQAVMGEMISMIAHQWRQPLSTITLQISNYQIKQLMSENQQKREIDKTLIEISNTIMYLSETVDDFQTYFRPNKEILHIDVGKLIQKAINFSTPRAREVGVNIVLHNTGNISIDTHINEVVQVILSILNNAIDALIEAKVKNPKIGIVYKNEENSIKISIEDNANGIDIKYIDKLFEPYFSTKGKNGTGLGLYMSQMIMQKQFDNEIEVKSSSMGSIFSFQLPKSIS
ncbi:HAMP domain-containing sensor histidine kinase [Sulfurimonas sp.]|uniref:sensor histidine kinase n=1 Tax=Sulfurimonas sp. TaxID=2022749 RepID=UPI002B45DDEF|nr:HAMP domain-containing sensor histidine kinase [Sulfurimonas sp.]